MTTTMTNTKKSSPFVARTRGQVMVLGCVTLLVMALMLMVSFNVTNAVHEKIRIQAHSDAAAFSMATVEARAFNATAHYNRAIAATLVAQMSLHSWMAIATADISMLRAGMLIMFIIAGLETAMGCYYPNFSHCPCVIEALICAFKFMSKASEWGNTLEGREQDFNDGVDGLKKQVDDIYEHERDMLDRARNELMIGQVLNTLKDTNAPQSSYVMALNSDTQNEYDCAMEGSNNDGSSCDGRDKSSTDDRSTVMQNTANATRPLFDTMGAMASFVLSDDNWKATSPDEPNDALTSGDFTALPFITRAVVGNKTPGYFPSADKDEKAEAVGAGSTPSMAMVTNFKHSSMVMVYGGKVASDDGGGSHSAMPLPIGHSGSHDKFTGVYQGGSDPCSNENCFVNFRAINDADKDFGMPSVYAGVSQNLRTYRLKSGGFKAQAPWEITDTGKTKVELERGKPAELSMAPRKEGKAVSKAKTYFHQLGTWSVAPNFFDPFWRAKLHFFSRDEAQSAVGKANDNDGTQIIGGGGPVEGAI